MKRFSLILLLLAGCSFGPDHEPPCICAPSEYEEAPHNTAAMDLSSWWQQFKDCQLNSLIEEALSCNYDLNIALHKIEEVRALYKIDRSTLYPQIQGNFVAIRSRRSENLTSDVIELAATPAELIPDVFAGPLIQNFFQLGFDASWEIDLWGKNRKRAKAGFYEYEASQENALDIQISLISDVASSYIDIRTLQQEIQARQEQIKRQEELVSLAESRYQAGLTSYLDVSSAKALLETQTAALQPFEEQLKQTIHGLAILLGRPPEGFHVCFGHIPKAAGVIPNELPSTLLCRRPDIRQVERQLAAATARIGVAIAELFPTFSLTGSFGTQANIAEQLFVWPSRFWTIGPTMIWNLFTGGKLIAQIKVENERQKQALLTYERTVINAFREVEDRLVGYFREEKRLEALEDRLSQTSIQRDLTLDQYVSGLIAFDQVLDAEKELFKAHQEMLASEGTLMIQLVGLYKSLGGGWQCCDLP